MEVVVVDFVVVEEEEEEDEGEAAVWEEEGVAVMVELGEVCSSARSLCLRCENERKRGGGGLRGV